MIKIVIVTAIGAFTSAEASDPVPSEMGILLGILVNSIKVAEESFKISWHAVTPVTNYLWPRILSPGRH